MFLLRIIPERFSSAANLLTFLFLSVVCSLISICVIFFLPKYFFYKEFELPAANFAVIAILAGNLLSLLHYIEIIKIG